MLILKARCASIWLVCSRDAQVLRLRDYYAGSLAYLPGREG